MSNPVFGHPILNSPYAYPRNTDLDPQLVWRGKDKQDWSDVVAHAPPLYILEKVHLNALIDSTQSSIRRCDPDFGYLESLV